ncbi:MAG: amidase, partial [Chloroflexi bacterium]|nr:amidase [Chloroflexota bacterium]
MPEIQELTASALRSAYLSNELSPVEVTAALLDRIDRLNPGLRAFVALCPEEAMSAARYAEAEIRRADPYRTPPLFGVPITIKDLVDVAGMPTTMGSLVTTREPAANDEAFVESLRGAGAIILGKTNTSEFGLAAQTSNRLGEPCANPWDSERTAGGSSGGAAAACAAGLGPLHHGTDGGGSVRVPAACCGVFGFKPTGRRIPRRSRGAGMSQISSDGVLARSVVDIAMM